MAAKSATAGGRQRHDGFFAHTRRVSKQSSAFARHRTAYPSHLREIDPFQLTGLVSMGPMARNVADASALFSTMAGFESQAPTSPNSPSHNPVRVGWLGNAGGIWPMDDGLLDQCEQAVFQLIYGPAFSIDHCLPPPQLAELWECWMTLRQHALSSLQAHVR